MIQVFLRNKKNLHYLRLHIFSVFILTKLSACEANNGEIVTNEGDPSNLAVQVSFENENTVKIRALADNVAQFQFRIDESSEPFETNTTGIFQHTFPRSGNYSIDVRAYGVSGRFIREVVDVNINLIMQGYITPLEYEGYTLVWNDEFSGTSINDAYWSFERGTGCPHLCGWGNAEWQYYRRENARVEDGVLIIEARQENFEGSEYTSARMITQGKRSFQYGRIDIRAKLPVGQGMWPALWMLGNDITTVGWPRCGEIDIMEMIGGRGRENTVHGTVHWYNNGHNFRGGDYILPAGIFADEYHVFTALWDERSIQFLVNDTEFWEIDITPPHMSEFHQPYFFIFNIAIGGRWPGYPDATTIFPQQMRVDYVRVFQRN